MAQPPRSATTGTFFITALTHTRRRIFTVDRHAQLFLDTLQHYRRAGLYRLHDFVAMPDHIHLLLTTDDLPAAMKAIKGGFSHRLASAQTTWQRGYTDHLVLTRSDFDTHRAYIRNNPVRAHLCQLPEQYPYSSAPEAPTP
jgi:putative transposase